MVLSAWVVVSTDLVVVSSWFVVSTASAASAYSTASGASTYSTASSVVVTSDVGFRVVSFWNGIILIGVKQHSSQYFINLSGSSKNKYYNLVWNKLHHLQNYVEENLSLYKSLQPSYYFEVHIYLPGFVCSSTEPEATADKPVFRKSNFIRCRFYVLIVL